MLFHPDRTERLAELADRLCVTDTATADLVGGIASEAVRHLSAPGLQLKTAQLNALIKAGAWTDAALALIEIELPRWKIRRLAYDEGEWHCALSLRRELPEWLDQAVETSHPSLPLAILKGFVEAMQLDSNVSGETRTPMLPRFRLKRTDRASDEMICCENFT